MAFEGHRYIYAGTGARVLCRIDTKTDRIEKVAHVMATGRFPRPALWVSVTAKVTEKEGERNLGYSENMKKNHQDTKAQRMRAWRCREKLDPTGKAIAD